MVASLIWLLILRFLLKTRAPAPPVADPNKLPLPVAFGVELGRR